MGPWRNTSGTNDADHTVPFLRRHPGYGGQDGTDPFWPHFLGISCQDFGELSRVATITPSLRDKFRRGCNPIVSTERSGSGHGLQIEYEDEDEDENEIATDWRLTLG